MGRRIPPNLLRLANALRYRRRGLSRVIREIDPDVLHAHYVVEYGFFAATTGFHPLVVSAWGSDVLVAARSSPPARMIARYTLRRADLVTSNNEHMTSRLRDMGVPSDKLATIVLRRRRVSFSKRPASVNLRPDAIEPPTIISTRSLDSPLYNIDLVLRALALLRTRLPDAQLLVAGVGRLRPALEALAQRARPRRERSLPRLARRCGPSRRLRQLARLRFHARLRRHGRFDSLGDGRRLLPRPVRPADSARVGRRRR